MKKSLLYFWHERRVLCVQQRTCQKSWQKIFYTNVDKSYYTNFLKDHCCYRISVNSFLPWIVFRATIQCTIFPHRGCFPKFVNGLNIKIGIFQKVYEWPSCPFVKMIPWWENHFGKRTAWSLIYFLNYAYFDMEPIRKFWETPSIFHWVMFFSFDQPLTINRILIAKARKVELYDKFLGNFFQIASF